MSLKLIFAASLVATFVAWYVFSLIPGRTPRGILRATFIALLCSPGIIVGHGFAVVPSLFAGVGIVAWWTLMRHARAESSTTEVALSVHLVRVDDSLNNDFLAELQQQ